jgi:hypothetical protein
VANLLREQLAAKTLASIATNPVISLQYMLASNSFKEPCEGSIGNWRRGFWSGTHKSRSTSTARTAVKKQTTRDSVIASVSASSAIG